jgi:amidase
MGGDQGGSIRIPSSFCGLVGLKATHGLVPYTGVLGIDASLDYTGPMTRTVEDAALAMDAIAGRDGLDPRQPHDLELQDYSGALEEDVSDMTVGVLQEGFEHEAGDEAVNEVVRDAIADLEAMGVETTTVSAPDHLDASDINMAIVRYGYGQLLLQNGVGTGFDGWYDTGLVEYLGRAMAGHSSDLPPSVMAGVLVSEYLRRNYEGSVYGHAQNLTLELRETYNEALADVDALVMPTVPIKPPEHGEMKGLETMLEAGAGSRIGLNTGPFNSTHHPGLTVPCGTTDGAPVGMMFVGERFDDATLLKLGYAYEQYD